MSRLSGLFAAVVVVLATACGSGDGVTSLPLCPADTFCMSASNQFSPRTMTVPAGTVVTWTNSTSDAHNVIFSTAGATAAQPGDGSGDINSFTSGSHSRKFTTAGTYPFNCTIHPGMSGTLTVQ